MKAKHVKSVCRKKFDDFVRHVERAYVQEALQNGTIITGGSIVSMLLGEDVNDFDLYFRDRQTCKVVSEYFVDKFKENPPPRFRDGTKHIGISVDDSKDDRIAIKIQSAGAAGESGGEYEYFEQDPEADAAEYVEKALEVAEDSESKPKYRPVFLSANAITLADKVQLVTRFYGEPEDIHHNYDFAHCTSHWTSWDNKLALPPAALESLLARDLRYVGSKYPICSLVRARKFIQRGWSITAGQLLKIAMQITDLDLTDLNVLEEQLTGVDTAYFVQVLRALRERDPAKVDAAYLVELIDRIF